MKKFLFFCLSLILISSVYAPELDVGYLADGGEGNPTVVLEPEVPETGGLGNISNGTLYHNELMNLNWSVANHYMDSNLNMSGSSIRDVRTIRFDNIIGTKLIFNDSDGAGNFMIDLGGDRIGYFVPEEQLHKFLVGSREVFDIDKFGTLVGSFRTNWNYSHRIQSSGIRYNQTWLTNDGIMYTPNNWEFGNITADNINITDSLTAEEIEMSGRNATFYNITCENKFVAGNGVTSLNGIRTTDGVAWVEFTESSVNPSYPRGSFLIGSTTGDSIINSGFSISPDISSAVQKPMFIEVRTNPINSVNEYRLVILQDTTKAYITSASNLGTSAGTVLDFATRGSNYGTPAIRIDNGVQQYAGVRDLTPDYNWDVEGNMSTYNLTVRNNLTVGGDVIGSNVFIPQYVFSHTDKSMLVTGAGVWTNITFDQEDADIKSGIEHTYSDNTNWSFRIMESGIYNVDYDLDLEDTSAGASDIDVAGRLILQNGSEVAGSVFETSITRQGAEIELSHNFLVDCKAGENFTFQFIASDADVQISTHGIYGDHPESATVLMHKIAN
jgi:hypothetical protein